MGKLSRGVETRISMLAPQLHFSYHTLQPTVLIRKGQVLLVLHIIGWRSVCPCRSTIRLHWHSQKLSIVTDDRWGLSTHLWFVWYCIEVQIPSLKKPSLHVNSWHSSSSFYLGLGLWQVTCWRVQFNRVPCKFFSSLRAPFPPSHSHSPPSQLMCCSLVHRFQCTVQSITGQWGTQMKLSFGNI